MSFKLFAKDSVSLRDSQHSASRLLVEDIVNRIEKLKTPLGIILRHHYGYESKSIYGSDRLLLDGLEERGLGFDLQPILICFDGEGSHIGGEGYTESNVYTLTEESLDIVRETLEGGPDEDEYAFENTRKRRKENNDKQMLFIHGCKREPSNYSRNGFQKLWESDRDGLWVSEDHEAADWTGNSSRGYSEHSVYVRYAVMVRPK